MSDVFREVDDDLRRGQLRQLWKRYGRYVIAGAVLIVVAVAAYGVITSIQARRAAEEGDRYLAAIDLRTAGQAEAAEAAFTALMADGAGGYPTLAAFNLAVLKSDGGDPAGAAAIYDAIALDDATVPSLRDLARYRAALVLLDTAPLDEIQERLEPLAVEGGAFRYLALEAMALSAFRVGDSDRAIQWLSQIGNDPNAPGDTVDRATRLFAVLIGRVGVPGAEAVTAAPPINMRVGGGQTPAFTLPEAVVPPIDMRRQGAPEATILVPGAGAVLPFGAP